MYELTITDDTGSLTLPMLEVPLNEKTIEGATDVQTLDLNVYTDFFAKKRVWRHTWAYLSEDEFEDLKGYYDRQFTLFKYPTITITDLNVTDVVVRMSKLERDIIDNCGEVRAVDVEFRETIQMSDPGSS